MTEKRKAYLKKWRAMNKEKIAARTRAWLEKNREHTIAYRAANKERIARRARAWWMSHPESARLSNKKYQAANKERMAHKARAWAVSHPESIRLANRKYRASHPHSVRKTNQSRRARKLGCSQANPELISKWETAWRTKAKATCYWCKRRFHPKACHTDHIVPLALGGPHAIENLCISCANCNQRKSCKALSKWSGELASPVLLL